jgi:hypothetical protein
MIIAGDALAATVIVASLSTFTFIILEKWKAIDYLQMNATRIFGRFKNLPTCLFCMMFWIGFLISVPLWISNIIYIVVPFASAPMARALYENCNTPRIR